MSVLNPQSPAPSGSPPPKRQTRAGRVLARIALVLGFLWVATYSFGMLMAPWWPTSEAGSHLLILLVAGVVVVLSLAWLVRTGSSRFGAAVAVLVLISVEAMPVMSIVDRIGTSDDPCSISGMGILDRASFEAEVGQPLTESPGSYEPNTYYTARVGDEVNGVVVKFAVDAERAANPINKALATVFDFNDSPTVEEEALLDAWFGVMAQCQPDAVAWLRAVMRREVASSVARSYERAFGAPNAWMQLTGRQVMANYNLFYQDSVRVFRIEFGRW